MSSDQAIAEFVSYALLAVFLTITLANRSMVHPLLNLVNRWVRWVLFANTIAFLVTSQSWTDRPFWAVFIIAFLIWFLLETIYNWIYIRALSFSEVPLFPRYRTSQKEEWPIDARWIDVKRWMRESSYQTEGSYEALLIQDLMIRNVVFDRTDKMLRIQVVFLPQTSSRVPPYFILTSIDQDGQRVVTNNLPLPFGGIYPKSWNVARRPLTRKIDRLVEIHEQRVLKKSFKPVAFDDNALEELNRQQQALEQANVQGGFLHAHEYREDYGVLSSNGRYRLWKEIWSLNYLGKAIG